MLALPTSNGMRFEVPQFIEVEDKIFGPFTWKQFVYLAGGAGAAVILFFSLPLFLFALIGIPVMALAGFLAFHQVNNRPFSIFLESFVQFATGDKLYIWRKKTPQEIVIKEEHRSVQSTPTGSTYTPPTSRQNIAKLSHKLELNSLDT